MKARRRVRRNPIGEAILGGVLGGTAGVLTDRVIWHSRGNPSAHRHCSACGSPFHDKRFHTRSKAERYARYRQMADSDPAPRPKKANR